MFIVVSDHRDHSRAETRSRPLLPRGPSADQLRHEVAIVGNHHFLVRGQRGDDFPQLRLSFINADGG